MSIHERVRGRLSDALTDKAFWGFPEYRRRLMANDAVDVLLSLPGIAIVDTTADTHRVAEALYKACHSEWRGFIPRSIELRYHRMARAALLAAADAAEQSAPAIAAPRPTP